MLKKIKDKILKIQLNRSKSKVYTQKQFTTWAQTQKIGILFRYKDINNSFSIGKFAHNIEWKGKTVQWLCFIDEEKKQQVQDENILTFSPKDISLSASTNNNSLANFCNTEFDYLFSIQFEENIYLKWVLLNCKSKCLAGLYNENNLLDLMLVNKNLDSIDEVIQEIVTLIKKIK